MSLESLIAYVTDLQTLCMLIASAGAIFVILGVFTGNVYILKALNRIGIPLLSGKPHKDYRLAKLLNPEDTVAWISIPDTCYAPVMTSKDRDYKVLTWKKAESYIGELHIDSPVETYSFSHLGRDSNNRLKDLTVINGNSWVVNRSIRLSQFTCIDRYLKTDLHSTHPDIILVEDNKTRIFSYLFEVEIGVEQNKRIKFTDRESFLASMRKIASNDTHRTSDGDILILCSRTGIDTKFVFIAENVEEGAHGSKEK